MEGPDNEGEQQQVAFAITAVQQQQQQQLTTRWQSRAFITTGDRDHTMPNVA